MIIYVDEGGLFLPSYEFSVVCSLAMPHRAVEKASAEFATTSQTWPRINAELKGGNLGVAHLCSMVDVLFRHNAILHCCAFHVSPSDEEAIRRHKAAQCEGMTANLTLAHRETHAQQIWNDRRMLEKMPNQLYLQCIAMSELVWGTVQDLVNYFAQRQPIEIASFEWIVDAKDPTRISPQEQWWRDTLGPLLEGRSRRGDTLNLVRGSNFNYRHFKRAFRSKATWWWPDRPRQHIVGYDIKKLVTDKLHFVDSRSDIMIQAADILSSFMRRALIGELHDESALRALGKLQLLRRRDGKLQCVSLLSVSDRTLRNPALVRAIRIMSQAGRSMLRR